jgi:predicted DCC family thiol-disulfide oxidoreductase YuxK
MIMRTDQAWTHLLLFDGICYLCDHTVQWVLAHDRHGIIHFCSIQSEFGSQLYRQHGYDPTQPESMVFITPEGSFVKSDAALKITGVLGGRLAWLRYFQVIPRSWRDLAYTFIARNRYRFFGKKDTCQLPRPECKTRFIG